MKTANPDQRNSSDIWLPSILIIASAVAAFLVVINIKITPDSMRFGLVAEQIMSGNGIRVPVIRLEDDYVPVNGAIPFLDQMPLLPLIFALLGGISPHNFLPAQILNILCHVAISVFTFLLMANLCGSKRIALLTGILVSFSYPLLKLTHIISSEPLFIALTTAAVYYLLLSRDSGRSGTGRSLFISSLCAGAAIMTRNAGIALVPLFFWEAAHFYKRKNIEKGFISRILAVLIPVAVSVAMFFRNYLLSGTFRGFNQASPERPYADAFVGTINMIFEQFQIGKNGVIMIVCAIVILLLYVLVNAERRRDTLAYLRNGLDLIMVFITSYTGLVFLTMAKQQWRYELRYVTPLVPFLFILSVAIIVFIWGNSKSRKFATLSLIGLTLSLGVLSAGNFYKTYLNIPEFSHRQERQYSILNSCTYQWIKDNCEEDDFIATNRPFHLSFFGGYSTIALPHKRFNPTIHVPENMGSVLPDRMLRVGSRTLALFEKAEARYEGGYIESLFNVRGSNDRFDLAYECGDGVVYYLRE
jgi:4-amino-4-deoxy-L-arabinose transferase-like glycosyltransferase